jgi:hypothetical protein
VIGRKELTPLSNQSLKAVCALVLSATDLAFPFFEKGLTTEEVMGMSGHRTYAMLARYTHLRAQKIADKLG